MHIFAIRVEIREPSSGILSFFGTDLLELCLIYVGKKIGFGVQHLTLEDNA